MPNIADIPAHVIRDIEPAGNALHLHGVITSAGTGTMRRPVPCSCGKSVASGYLSPLGNLPAVNEPPADATGSPAASC